MARNKKAINASEIKETIIPSIIEDYTKNNMSLRTMEKKYKIQRRKLSQKLEELGVKKTKGNHYRYYFHNYDYFEVINTHDKAYFLGLMMADGFISDNSKIYGQDSFGILLNIDDLHILESFKKHIEATNEIKIYVQHGGFSSKKSEYCKLLMKSQKTVDDLIDKGVIKQKTLTKEFPDKSKVPEEFIYSYLRGYMDGNGCIGLRKTKTQGIKGELSFTTSEKFALGLKEFGECNVFKDKRANAWRVDFYNKSSKEILDRMYENSTEETRLKRKYDKYLKIKKDE